MVKIHMDVDICIIGAGVAGLSAAKLLYEKGYSIYVAEAQEKVGGRIQTDWIKATRETIIFNLSPGPII